MFVVWRSGPQRVLQPSFIWEQAVAKVVETFGDSPTEHLSLTLN